MYENGEIPLKLNSSTYRDTITVPFGGAVVARIVADNPGKGLVTLNKSEPPGFGHYRTSTNTFDALDLTVQGPGLPPPDTRPYCKGTPPPQAPASLWTWNLTFRRPLPYLILLLTSGDHHWRPVETAGHPRPVLTPGGY